MTIRLRWWQAGGSPFESSRLRIGLEPGCSEFRGRRPDRVGSASGRFRHLHELALGELGHAARRSSCGPATTAHSNPVFSYTYAASIRMRPIFVRKIVLVNNIIVQGNITRLSWAMNSRTRAPLLRPNASCLPFLVTRQRLAQTGHPAPPFSLTPFPPFTSAVFSARRHVIIFIFRHLRTLFTATEGVPCQIPSFSILGRSTNFESPTSARQQAGCCRRGAKRDELTDTQSHRCTKHAPSSAMNALCFQQLPNYIVQQPLSFHIRANCPGGAKANPRLERASG